MENGWTAQTLYAHISQRLADKDKRDDDRFNAQNEAIQKAYTSQEKRLDGMNEFRAQMKDQQANFVTKAESELKFENLTAQMKAQAEMLRLLHEANVRGESKRAGAINVGTVVAWILGLVGTGLAIWANLNK